MSCPRHAEVDELIGLGDRGGDRRQRVVLVLGDARRNRQDEVGIECSDGLVAQLAELEVQDLGVGVIGGLLGPGLYGARLVDELRVASSDRRHAEGEDVVELGVAQSADALRRFGDLGVAELVTARSSTLGVISPTAESGRDLFRAPERSTPRR